MRWRPVPITFGICATVVCVAAGVASWQRMRGAEQAERARRRTSIAILAPVPLPSGLPLVGEPGTDADGYPRRYVDKAALRALLWHGKYPELTRYFGEFQAAFEADPRNEYWPIDAGDAFHSSELELLAALDGWVAADSNSFAPYLARGAYWTDVVYNQRGGRSGADTPDGNFDAMRIAAGRALADLERALSLRPKLVAAMRYQMNVLRATAEKSQLKRVFDNAIAVCPSCYQVRVTYMFSLEPRYGGSHQEMDALARRSADPSNSRTRRLAGFADLDRAEMLELGKKYDQALAAIEQACSVGDQWEFLLERSDIQAALGNATAAMADVQRAAVVRPNEPRIFWARAWLHRRAKQWEAAGTDLLAGLRLDPTDSHARNLFDSVINGLIYEGWENHKAGRRTDALRVLDLAAELAPNNKDVTHRRSYVIAGNEPPSEPAIAALEQAARDHPDDFRAHQQLDYSLAWRGRFDQVIKMWDEYLARHPDDGRAHLERGGAYCHVPDGRAAAVADGQKACELGLSEGCALVRRIAAPAK